MMNFFQRLQAFMAGRYGMDTLNGFLIGVTFFLWFVNIFVFNRLASMIIYLLQLAVMAYVVFRALSRNITMRSAENRTFLKAYNPVKNRVKLLIKKFRERDEYKYIKCPHCKAQLRVRNQKGKHTVKCPRCQNTFEKKI